MKLVAAFALCALAGCGQKGPLVRPDEPPVIVPANPAGGQAADDSKKKANDPQR
jgi:predicted small lipoprotein YifL